MALDPQTVLARACEIEETIDPDARERNYRQRLERATRLEWEAYRERIGYSIELSPADFHAFFRIVRKADSLKLADLLREMRAWFDAAGPA